MLDQVKEAVKAYQEVDDTVPRLLNKSAVREVLSGQIQVGDHAIDFLDFVVYALLKFIVMNAKLRGIKRLSAKNVRDILAEDRAININIGSITYQDVEFEEAENRIVDRIYKKIIMKTVSSATEVSHKKTEDLDIDSIEFPEEDGVENE